MNTDTNDPVRTPEIGRIDVSSIVSDAEAERDRELRLLELAVARTATDRGDRHDLRDVATRLGFDPDELATEAAAELANGD